jgi:hypothetical protein
MANKKSYYERNKSKVLEKNRIKREEYLKEKQKILDDFRKKYPNLNYLRISDYEKHEKEQLQKKDNVTPILEEDLIVIREELKNMFINFGKDSEDEDESSEVSSISSEEVEEINEMMEQTIFEVEQNCDENDKNKFIDDKIKCRLSISENWIVINGNMFFLDSLLNIIEHIKKYIEDNK